MRLSSVSAFQFKGSSFKHALAPFTVFHGPNFAGKSSRLEVMELALTGSVTGVGARSGDLFNRLASGNEMRAEATATDGRSVSRTFSRGKKDKIITSVAGDLTAPSVIFAPSEFLDLSGPALLRHLFLTLPPPPLELASPAAIVARLKTAKSEPHTEVHELAINEACDFVQRHFDDCDPVTTVQEWLGQLLEAAREKANASKAISKTMNQTLLGLSAMKPESLPALAPLEQAAAAAQKALTEAYADYRAVKSELQNVEAELKKWAVKPLADGEVSLAALSAEETALAPLANQNFAFPDGTAIYHAAATAAQKTASLSELLQAAEKKVTEFKLLECCPTCQSAAKGWQKKVLAVLKAEVDTLFQQTSEAITASQAATAAKEVLDKKIAEIRQAQSELAAKQERLSIVRAAIRARHDEVTAAQHRQRLLDRLAAAQTALHKIPNLDAMQAACDAAALAWNQAKSLHAGVEQEARAREESTKAATSTWALETLRDILDALLSEVVRQSVLPLIATCNRLAGGILKHPLAYKDGEFGMETPMGFITHRSFSGTEKALCYAGICIALAADAGKLLVLDELGRLDTHNREQVYHRIQEMVNAGELDQAIVLDVTPPPPFISQSSNAEVIEVERK